VVNDRRMLQRSLKRARAKPLGMFGDPFDRSFKIVQKPLRRSSAPLQIPIYRCSGFFHRSRVEAKSRFCQGFNRDPRRRLASSQGISFTAPLSISWRRRSISRRHAASVSSSTSTSRLSRDEDELAVSVPSPRSFQILTQDGRRDEEKILSDQGHQPARKKPSARVSGSNYSVNWKFKTPDAHCVSASSVAPA